MTIGFRNRSQNVTIVERREGSLAQSFFATSPRFHEYEYACGVPPCSCEIFTEEFYCVPSYYANIGERRGSVGEEREVIFFCFFFPPREEARVIPICTTTCKMVLAFLYLCTSTCIVHVHLPPSLCNNQAYEKESTKVFLLLFFSFFN